MYVFDATPLIYLASAERLGRIDALSTPCAMPGAIYDEVVRDGLDAGYPDARRIERAVDSGTLDVVDVEKTTMLERLERNGRLSNADAAVLALTDQRNGTAIMDERFGRVVADAEGIDTHGTAFVVLELLRDGRLTAAAARETIDEMVDTGWYCAPDLYAKIVRKIDDLA